MRINGWRRLGIAVSVLWLLFAIAYAVQQLHSADPKDYVVTGTKSFLIRFASDPPLARDFFARMSRRDTLSPDEHLLTLREAEAFVRGASASLDLYLPLAFTLGPIVAGWLVLELLARSMRWVWRGFRGESITNTSPGSEREAANPRVPNATDITNLHWIETYKSLITLSVEGFKFSLLANGGAAVALLSYLAAVTGRTPHVTDLRVPTAAFLLGLVVCGMAMLFAYFTQLKLLNEGSRPGHFPRLSHGWLLWLSIALFACSLGAFSYGCWQAVIRFAP